MGMELNRPEFIDLKPGEWPSLEQFNEVELKFDGWWGQLLLHADCTWELYSRSGQLKKTGMLTRSYGECVLHGEFVYGTEWAKDHQDLYDRIVLHSATRIDGLDVTKDPRFAILGMLRTLVLGLRANGERIENGVDVIEQFPAKDAPRVWEEYVVEKGYEGLVFKNSKGSFYTPMARMKNCVTMDYVCMGFEDSDSDTYAGIGVASLIGGLYVNGELVRKCRVSGLTDELRTEFYQHPDKYVGKVFEAAGKKVSKKGALRHPEFMRWRDDKLPKYCTWQS